jgi:hypothetical protein
MIIYEYSIANVIPTCPPLLLILAPRSVQCVFQGYSAHHKGYHCLDLLFNRVIISRHVIFDETTFPFAEHHCPSTPADHEFLDDDTTNVVPAPIGPLHKFLSVGTPPSASDATSTPIDPFAAMPGAPLELPEDVRDPSTLALYVSPMLRAFGTPTTPRVAAELTGAHGDTSPRLSYVPPALRTGSTSYAPSMGSPASSQAPRGPPSGFLPLRPAHDFTYHCSCRPRPPPTAPAPVALATSLSPTEAAPLPKRTVYVSPVANQHSMSTRSKSDLRMPDAYHVVPLSPWCRRPSETLLLSPIDEQLWKNTVLFSRTTPQILCPVRP